MKRRSPAPSPATSPAAPDAATARAWARLLEGLPSADGLVALVDPRVVATNEAAAMLLGRPRQALVNAFADFGGMAFTHHQARHVRQMPQMHFRSACDMFLL